MFPGPAEHIVANLSIGASLIIFLLTRYVRIDPATVLDFGLVYEVLGGLGIAVAETWNVDFGGQLAMMESGIKPWWGVPWVCVWILIFPVMIPSSPGQDAPDLGRDREHDSVGDSPVDRVRCHR